MNFQVYRVREVGDVDKFLIDVALAKLGEGALLHRLGEKQKQSPKQVSSNHLLVSCDKQKYFQSCLLFDIVEVTIVSWLIYCTKNTTLVSLY